MASDHSLTEWIPKLKASEKEERDEAARRIMEAFNQQLLDQVKRRLDPGAAAEPEDVVQSVFRTLIRRGPEFANRNAMFKYLQTVAIRKSLNINRDLRREIQAAQPEGVSRPYQVEVNGESAQLGSADSFFSDAPIRLLVHGASPDQAALVTDLVDCLKDHDEEEGDCLQRIVALFIENRSAKQIAKELGVSTKTIDRKRQLIQELWDECKPVLIRIDATPDNDPGQPITVVLTDTAAGILRRLKLKGYRLSRPLLGGPARHFENDEHVYDFVAEGDVLTAIRVTST